MLLRCLSLGLLATTLHLTAADQPPVETGTQPSAAPTESVPSASDNGGVAPPRETESTGQQTTRSQPQQGGDPGAGMNLFMLVMIGLIFFMIFSTFRGQKKEKQKKAQMVDALKIGDKVQTIGGLIGEIVRKGEHDIDIKTGGSAAAW